MKVETSFPEDNFFLVFREAYLTLKNKIDVGSLEELTNNIGLTITKLPGRNGNECWVFNGPQAELIGVVNVDRARSYSDDFQITIQKIAFVFTEKFITVTDGIIEKKRLSKLRQLLEKTDHHIVYAEAKDGSTSLVALKNNKTGFLRPTNLQVKLDFEGEVSISKFRSLGITSQMLLDESTKALSF